MSQKDSGLLKVSGLSASKAADIIGRSRQAVSRGVNLNHDYFELPEVQRLVSAITAQRPELRQRIADYVELHYNELAKYVGGKPVDITLSTALSTATTAWLFAPDYMNLSVREPQMHAAIIDIIRNPNIAFTAFLNGDADATRFKIVVQEHAPAKGKLDRLFMYDRCEYIKNMSTMLLFNPKTPTAFGMGDPDWYRMNQIEVQRQLDNLNKYLKEAFKTPPINAAAA